MAKTSYKARTGHERYKLRKKNSNGYSIARRKKALIGLEVKLQQIKEANDVSENPVDLSKDINYQRINKEIANIKKKVY